MSLTEQPAELIALLVILSLLPLLVVIGTSFLKISVVFALLRNALGIQQTPPNIALYGLALILTLFIMTPVLTAVQEQVTASSPEASLLTRISGNALAPYRHFLLQHTAPAQLRFFRDAARKSWPNNIREKVSDDSLLLLIPAFAVSQLIEAFKIGLLLFLPFIAIDLIVSNVLLAMGMMMVSPMTISMPFKLLVFVLVGGWDRLLSQLMLSYH
ncbi:type III secretion system export apparatus subunit SctR [Salmonella enterica]|nr:EscR/YscR/HrcR family type III secretion system export apparatus protein [Salmonella enterica subsp. enterica serovar Sandiego]EEC0251377.1 EscR/YscR/HrcR family type III secretion system export apparatus protein [Salmonella enterica subsp. enterica]EJW2128689.1 type III secretion system export apparatus subunit SctR [Salmonella enterica]EEE4266737.1 EscR/YscR/HrcR family type III secretion system export apparatus protein [Salmonella enterica subsp. enterica serovar Sandiego]EKT1704581.1 typ